MSRDRIFPNFQNCPRCEKDLKDNKDTSRHLGRKYARIFVLGHYLFLVAICFLGTDNDRGRMSEHIFAPNGNYCLFIPHRRFFVCTPHFSRNFSSALYFPLGFWFLRLPLKFPVTFPGLSTGKLTPGEEDLTI